MWNPIYDTNELIYETDSQTQRTDMWLPKGRGRGEGMDCGFGISTRKLLSYREWINNKVLLYSTENCIQYPGINHNGKENEKECIYI